MVVKIGGSLLEWPEFPGQLAELLDSLGDPRVVLVVGGGGFADLVRRLDRVHGLGESRSHALALWSLEVSARVVESLLPGSEVVEALDLARKCWGKGLTPIVSPRLIMEGEDRRSLAPLPESWATTTDSIAARVATLLGIEELILLKSTCSPIEIDRREAATIGLVDPVFPVASARLSKVTLVDLRAVPWILRVLS